MVGGEPQRKLSNSLRQFASLPVELIAARVIVISRAWTV